MKIKHWIMIICLEVPLLQIGSLARMGGIDYWTITLITFLSEEHFRDIMIHKQTVAYSSLLLLSSANISQKFFVSFKHKLYCEIFELLYFFEIINWESYFVLLALARFSCHVGNYVFIKVYGFFLNYLLF